MHPRPPVDLDDVWKKWLGTIQTDHFCKSRLVIVAQLQNSLYTRDNNLVEVQKRLHTFHCGLLLQGYGYCTGGLEVCGNTDSGLRLGPLGPVFPHAAIQNRAHFTPTADTLRNAYQIAQSLLGIYRYPRRFMRIRRSFDAWARGIRESEVAGYRLHNFVRAAEGLTQPPRARLTKSFEERAQTFVGHGHRSAALLRQLYNLRSTFEHIKWWRRELRRPVGLDVRESLLFRTLQAELLASDAFVKILCSRQLLCSFSSERAVERFWAMPEADRRKVWGKPLSIKKEADRLYIRLDR